MKNQGFGLASLFHCARRLKLIKQDVALGKEDGFVQAFGLHAKDDDHVGVLKRFLLRHIQPHRMACRRADFSSFAGNPHRWARKSEASPNFPRRLVWERATRRRDVPEDCDIELVQVADAIAMVNASRMPWGRVLFGVPLTPALTYR